MHTDFFSPHTSLSYDQSTTAPSGSTAKGGGGTEKEREREREGGSGNPFPLAATFSNGDKTAPHVCLDSLKQNHASTNRVSSGPGISEPTV